MLLRRKNAERAASLDLESGVGSLRGDPAESSGARDIDTGRARAMGRNHAQAGEQSSAKERDSESGLDHFGARSYSSQYARFTNVDPKRSSAILHDPQSWNRYSYTQNNPLKFVDPDGMNLELAPGLSKSTQSRITKDLSNMYQKATGRAAIQQLASSDIKYVIGSGSLSGKGELGYTDYGKVQGTIDRSTGQITSVDRTSINQVTITLDLKKMDARKAQDPVTTKGEEQHTVDHEVGGHAASFDTNPAAEQNKDQGHAEFDADNAADTIEKEPNTVGAKDATNAVRDLLKNPPNMHSDDRE